MSKAFVSIEPLDDGCVLGTRKMGEVPYWYVRMYWKAAEKPQVIYRTTKIPYEDSRASKNKAKRKANQIWRDFIASVSVGDSPIKARTVKTVADAYLKQITAWAIENEKSGKPINFIRGGRAVKGHSQHWTTDKVEAIKNIVKHLTGYVDPKTEKYVPGFFDSLPTQDFRKITERDLVYFSEWSGRNRDWSPSWTHRVITQIRMIWRFAFDEGWADFHSPRIFRPPAQTEERSRMKLQEQDWLRMVYWAKERYESITPNNKRALASKESAFQFWAWLNFISWTGIRPASGSVEKNLIRWDSIKELPNGDRVIVRADKTQYTAPILDHAHPFIDGLKALQEKRGMSDCPWVFAHTKEKAGFWKKGDPIKSFKKQWEVMLKDLELWKDWGTPQSEKLVPYSLRAFFITQSRRNGIDIHKLANSLGTSPRVISQNYDDFQTELEIEELTRRSGIQSLGSLAYDEEGFPILG